MQNNKEVLLIAEQAGLGTLYDNGMWVDFEVGEGKVLKFAELLTAAVPKPDETEMLRREIHNLKRHIEDYCKPVSGAVDELPPLPAAIEKVMVWAPIPGREEGATTNGECTAALHYYTAEQMRNYAIAARTALQPAQTAPTDAETEELIETLRGFSRAYPKDIFPPLDTATFDAIHKKYPGAIDHISATMGRHCGMYMAKAADALDRALLASQPTAAVSDERIAETVATIAPENRVFSDAEWELRCRLAEDVRALLSHPAAPAQPTPAVSEQPSTFTGSAAEIQSRLKQPLQTPRQRINQRKTLAEQKSKLLHEAIRRIREKARETPAWANAYNSAITTIELLAGEKNDD